MSRKKVVHVKRRFATLYFDQDDAPRNAYVTQGAAASPEGAIRATIVRVFMQQHAKAIIYDRELEVDVLTVRMTAHGLQAYYADKPHEAVKLRRVK